MQSRQMNRRLLLEDICSDIVRYLHADGRHDAFASVRIDREWNLGIPGAFADIRVRPADGHPYFVEIKTGYTSDDIVRRIANKYSDGGARLNDARRLIVVLETRDLKDRNGLIAAIREVVARQLEVEIWDEEQLDAYSRRLFGLPLQDLSDEGALVMLRRKINSAKAQFAFGDSHGPSDEIVRNSLLWHFGMWRLRELLEALKVPPADDRLVRPGHYERAIVLMADLSSFSSFVRDTPDEEIVRASLTAFYTKARYQVINSGGMLYQFVGDEVSAVFGVPDQRPGYVDAAAHAARALLEIGRSVAIHWQQRIDRVQAHCAAHIGMAMGDLDLVAQRPFDVSHLGAFGDCLNIAARLVHEAGPDEIVVSNVLRQALSDGPYACEERSEVEIRNLGTVKSWRLAPPSLQQPTYVRRATIS